VADAVIRNHTRVIDVDLKDYFGSIRQDLLLKKVAKRIDDNRVGRTKLFRRIREEFDRRRSQPIREVIRSINPIIRGCTR
jgi:retron-type reverse transcriptase